MFMLSTHFLYTYNYLMVDYCLVSVCVVLGTVMYLLLSDDRHTYLLGGNTLEDLTNTVCSRICLCIFVVSLYIFFLYLITYFRLTYFDYRNARVTPLTYYAFNMLDVLIHISCIYMFVTSATFKHSK